MRAGATYPDTHRPSADGDEAVDAAGSAPDGASMVPTGEGTSLIPGRGGVSEERPFMTMRTNGRENDDERGRRF